MLGLAAFGLWLRKLFEKHEEGRAWNYLIYFESLRRASGDVNENLVASNFRGIASHPHSRVLYNLAASDVVLPAMPGTCDHLLVELTLTKWPASVHAYVADGIEFSIDIGERYWLASNLKLVDCTSRHFGGLGGADKWHDGSFA
jgi:hypothetical protein